jgi:hypothetical protein
LIDGKYSIIGTYRKWKNGTPICEIVEMTGIKRKTWNKRFERLEKKHKPATSGDNSATELAISRRKDDENKFLFLILIVVLLIVLVIVGKNLYEEYNKWKKKNILVNLENNNKNVAI